MLVSSPVSDITPLALGNFELLGEWDISTDFTDSLES